MHCRQRTTSLPVELDYNLQYVSRRYIFLLLPVSFRPQNVIHANNPSRKLLHFSRVSSQTFPFFFFSFLSFILHLILPHRGFVVWQIYTKCSLIFLRVHGKSTCKYSTREESSAVEQVVACALVTQRARVRSPVGTSFLGEVFSGFFLTCKTNVSKL